MKIAITGSDGYIGSTLAEKLKDTDHDIHLLDINDWDIRTIPMKSGLPHNWLFFDAVVQLAALVKVGESVEKPCTWGLSLAYYFDKDLDIFIYYLFRFFSWRILMRSAGCIVNDIVDEKIDKS